MAFDQFDEMDAELAGTLRGIRAPANFAASVRNRIRTPAPTRLPEFLDGIGWVSVLSFAAGFAFFVIFK